MHKAVKLNRTFLFCGMLLFLLLHPQFHQQTAAAPLQGRPISITLKNMSLADILRQIARKSATTIYFHDPDLSVFKNISYEAKNKTVDNILHELLDERGFLIISISDKEFGVRKKNIALPDKPTDDTASTVVTGKVINEKGEPIIGASVQVKGTNMGTTTRPDGSFLIKDVPLNSSLLITNIAFLSEEVAIGGKSNLGIIKLKEFIGSLDETVVIAYGTTTKRMSTGNISTVKAKEIENSPVNNPLLTIAGRIPGVQISQATGLSGSGVKIIIQGQNSLFNGNDPFYVIDGVPYTSQLLPNLGSVLGTTESAGLSPSNFGNPLSFINPQDIESIEILKDADATAIYGSRAANGAILITTKKGKTGQTKIDLNIQSGFGYVPRKLKTLNTEQYLAMRKEAYSNDNVTIPSVPTNGAYDLTYWDQNRYTNWQKELIGGKAKYNDANLSFSGGNGNVQYLVRGGYHKETTVFPTDFSDTKGSVHFNINNISPNQRFTLTFQGTYLFDDNNLPNVDLTRTAMILAPNAPKLRKDDGSLNWEPVNNRSTLSPHPLGDITQLYKTKTNNLVSNANIGYEVLPGLNIKSSFGYTNMGVEELVVKPSTWIAPEQRHLYTRAAQYGSNNINSWIIEPQITYNTQIKNGKLQALIGTTIQQINKSRKQLEGKGYTDDLVMENLNAAKTITIPQNSTISSIYKYNALFTRITYSLNEKYIVNFSARRDGTSRFGSSNKFHNFSALGLAWIFSNENFLKSNPVLSFGKIKASYGTTGSDQIQDYSYLSLYDNNTPEVLYSGGVGLAPTGLTNPYIQWEEVKKFSTTLDLGFFHDRILTTVTYFRNRSSNQLLSYSLPPSSGFSSVTSNLPATVQNSGFEISLNTTNLRRKTFSWTSSFNITIPKNKLIKFDNLETSSYANDYKIGETVMRTLTYKYAGIDPKTGIYQFYNKEGNITSNPTTDPLNRIVTINTAQTLYGGFQNTLNYKGISLDFLIQFVKQKGPNTRHGYNFPPGRSASNQPITVLDRWRKADDNATVQRYSRSNFDYLNSWLSILGSDAIYGDASYARLKNVSISWQLPNNWIREVKLKSARVYVQGQNILTITGYEGLDPETRSSFTLPPLRVITFGIQVTL